MRYFYLCVPLLIFFKFLLRAVTRSLAATQTISVYVMGIGSYIYACLVSCTEPQKLKVESFLRSSALLKCALIHQCLPMWWCVVFLMEYVSGSIPYLRHYTLLHSLSRCPTLLYVLFVKFKEYYASKTRNKCKLCLIPLLCFVCFLRPN